MEEVSQWLVMYLIIESTVEVIIMAKTCIAHCIIELVDSYISRDCPDTPWAYVIHYKNSTYTLKFSSPLELCDINTMIFYIQNHAVLLLSLFLHQGG